MRSIWGPTVRPSYSTPRMHKRVWKCAKGCCPEQPAVTLGLGALERLLRAVHIVVTIQTPTGDESSVRSREFAQAFADALEVNGVGRIAAAVRDALEYRPNSKLVKVAHTEASGVSFAARRVAGHAETPDTWDRITSVSQREPEISELRWA
jgi:hypothetical protein